MLNTHERENINKGHWSNILLLINAIYVIISMVWPIPILEQCSVY